MGGDSTGSSGGLSTFGANGNDGSLLVYDGGDSEATIVTAVAATLATLFRDSGRVTSKLITNCPLRLPHKAIEII